MRISNKSYDDPDNPDWGWDMQSFSYAEVQTSFNDTSWSAFIYDANNVDGYGDAWAKGSFIPNEKSRWRFAGSIFYDWNSFSILQGDKTLFSYDGSGDNERQKDITLQGNKQYKVRMAMYSPRSGSQPESSDVRINAEMLSAGDGGDYPPPVSTPSLQHSYS
jgi:hypothetical protein